MKKVFKRTKFVYTPDFRWFQAYPDKTIQIVLKKLPRQNPPWIISIWGDDDTGLIKSFKDFNEALIAFNAIQDGITQKQLMDSNFKIP